MKKTISIILVLIMILSLAACSNDTTDTEAKEGAATSTETKATETEEEILDIAVLIKSTDSSFWQKVSVGAEAYAEEHDNVNITIQGPASEADIEDSLGLLENVILSQPDAIVIATNAGTGANAAIADAKAAGIPVITIDTSIPSEDVTSHLATDNLLGGELAGEAMYKYMVDNNIELKGKVAIIAAVAGVSVIDERDNGFKNKLNELAPDIEVLDPIYIQNEIAIAMQSTENLITAHGDELIGIYADANHPGDGVSRAVEQAGLQDQITVVAFDDDQEEIDALNSGVIKALIIQNQHSMGYLGVETAVQAANGETLPEYIDTGVNVTWPGDVN